MDIDELNNLIENEGKAIYSFCYKLTKNKLEADDLYQETFLKTIEKCDKLNIKDNPKSFILSIAIGLYKNKIKKFAIRQRIAPDITSYDECEQYMTDNYDNSLEDTAIQSELSLIIKNEVDKLNDKLRIPVYLYYTAELSIKAISEILKIPMGTVKSRLQKSRKIIKEKLEEQGYEG